MGSTSSRSKPEDETTGDVPPSVTVSSSRRSPPRNARLENSPSPRNVQTEKSTTVAQSAADAFGDAPSSKIHINSVGELVYKGHDAWDLVKSIQMGIKFSVDTGASAELFLNSAAFEEEISLNFPHAGSSTTPAHEMSSFHFKDYRPRVFRSLRNRFAINETEYLLSICADESLRILGTPGKSGALFFFSSNMKYILKTLSKSESKFFRRILPYYVEHVSKHRHSLLPKFYGMHRIENGGNKIRFVVMNNLFDTDKPIHAKYDLKGSTVGRSAGEKKGKGGILKDLDVHEPFRLGPQKRALFLQQLEYDCAFLETMCIMDYSLLVGVHYFADQSETILTSHVPSGRGRTYSVLDASPLAHVDRLSALNSIDENSPVRRLDLDNVEDADVQILQIDSIPIELESEHPCPKQDVSPSSIQGTLSSDAEANPVPGSSLPCFDPSTSVSVDEPEHPDHFSAALFPVDEIDPFREDEGGLYARDDDLEPLDQIYYVGIIDILQEFTTRKQLEYTWKSLVNEKGDISVNPPGLYAARFQRYLASVTV